MAYLEATVDFVSVKELDKPDPKFGYTHRRSIKIGEDWYSCGNSKTDKFSIKQGNEWVEVTKGAKVEFKYTEKGDFKNVSMKTFEVVAQGEPAGSKPASKPSSVPQNKDFVNPAEVGQCLNLAVQVLGFKEKDTLDPDKVKEAIQWYKRSRQLFGSLFPSVDVEEEKPKPKKAAPKKKEPEPDYDEDIPFDEDEEDEI